MQLQEVAVPEAVLRVLRVGPVLQRLHLDPSCLLYHFFYYCALYTTASQHQPTALSHAEVVRYGNTLLRLLRASMDVASCPRPDA